MAQTYELNAQMRTAQGKGASRRLRNADKKIPAIIYGPNYAAKTITLDQFQVVKALENKGFYSHILTLNIDGHKEKAVLKALQRHPFKPMILHMDFYRIDEKQKMTLRVPLKFIGEDVAPGVKIAGGILSHLMVDIEISCLPADLPESIAVDVSTLEIEEAIHLSQLKLPKGVQLAHAGAHDAAVISIHMPRAEEEKPAQAAEATPAAPAAADAKAQAKPKDDKKK